MSNDARAERLPRLGELSRACPEMGFGQPTANLAVAARGTEPGAVWDMEDEELLAAVNRQLAELLARRGSQVAQEACASPLSQIPSGPGHSRDH